MSEEIYTPLTKKDRGPMRYQCFQPAIRDSILSINMSDELRQHINELYELIFYQMHRISEQESQMIAIKHKYAWQHYDKPPEHYNESERRYFTTEELQARKC